MNNLRLLSWCERHHERRDARLAQSVKACNGSRIAQQNHLCMAFKLPSLHLEAECECLLASDLGHISRISIKFEIFDLVLRKPEVTVPDIVYTIDLDCQDKEVRRF